MSTLDNRLDVFEKRGPFTFERVFQLVKMCARSKDTDFHDVLDNNWEKFSPGELTKILNAHKTLSPEDHKIWEAGLSCVEFVNYEGNFSDRQLEVVAKTELEDYENHLHLSEMDYEDKLAILKAHNRHLRKRAIKTQEREDEERDVSPIRKIKSAN